MLLHRTVGTTANTNLASSLLDSAFWAGAARHPPRPRPARRALPQGSVAREVEDGKTSGVGRGGSLPLGRSALRAMHGSPLSCVFAYGGLGGGAHVCVRLCRLCGTGRGADANWKRELTRVGLGISGFRTRFCSAGRQSCQGARWGLYPHLSRDSHPGPRTRLLTLSRDCPPPPCPDSALDCLSPHRRGCLFLLGLSMLSLFKRLCHRLDAGNKVRRCV